MRADPQLYASGLGDRLIDAARYPSDIQAFLISELTLLGTFVDKFSRLVEVGAMEGRHLDWAIEHNKEYLGIDATKKFVDTGTKGMRARGLDRNRYCLLHGRAEELHHLAQLRDRGRSPLIFFPFNSIGNMEVLSEVLRSLAELRYPFFISTYTTSSESTLARSTYYENCGFDGLSQRTDDKSILFQSNDGLSSKAFRQEFFLETCSNVSLAVRSVALGRIGVAYISPELCIHGASL
ncbi:hypothetical protein [Bradyrhizobium japonicum]|uniref:hypothetical protein n=1 Tax=Bradyrhizobium japonicum TaxID=375 RepID=UPI001BADADA9|nr:hypothetical protein [Bradyrhizobium japonicum]MBR0764487.1 hypothetical protein [Bradyrhizobium japonicum]